MQARCMPSVVWQRSASGTIFAGRRRGWPRGEGMRGPMLSDVFFAYKIKRFSKRFTHLPQLLQALARPKTAHLAPIG